VFNLSNASRTSLRASLEGMKDVATLEELSPVEDGLPSLTEEDELPDPPFVFTQLQLVESKTPKASRTAAYLNRSDMVFSPPLPDSFQLVWEVKSAINPAAR
jgi:hypothetical protein